MASKYLASDIDALLDCPLCKERYNDTTTPKILNCGHTVCVECLRTTMKNQTLQCPVCLKVTPAPKGNVELLVSSLVVLELLDIRQAQCKQCTIQIKTKQCFHCMEEMCTVCLEEHRIKSESNFQGLHKKLEKSAQDLESYMLHIDTALANAETDANDLKQSLDAVFGKVLSEMAKRKASLLSILDNNIHKIRASHMIIKSLLESKLNNTTSLAQTINLNLVNGIHTVKHEHVKTTIECGASRIKEAEATLSLCSFNMIKLHLDINVEDIVSHIQRWGKIHVDEVVSLKPYDVVEQAKQKGYEQGVLDNTSISITIADNELVSKSPETGEIPVHQMSLSAGLSFSPPIAMSPCSMSSTAKNGAVMHPTSVLGSNLSKPSSYLGNMVMDEKTDIFKSMAYKFSERKDNITVDKSKPAPERVEAISEGTVPRIPGPGYFSSPDRLPQQLLTDVSAVRMPNFTTLHSGQLLPPAHIVGHQILGGAPRFTFTPTPVVSKSEEKLKQTRKTFTAPVAVKDEEKGTTNPVNIFANLSFVSPKALPNIPNTEAYTTPSTTKNEPISMMPKSSVFGSDPSGLTPTFGSIADSGKTDVFAKSSRVTISGGSTLFKAPSSQMSEPKIVDLKEGDVSEATGVEKDYEPVVDFQPIISLPEVELITEEEDEVTLFSERAKLYRNDTKTKEWQEMGVGMMKILENEKVKRFRIFMRSDQHCANHNIAIDMKLKRIVISEWAWCWLAQDYSEEDMQNEKFAVKFKTNDEAAHFKQVFERCQEKLLQYKQGEMKSTLITETSSISSVQQVPVCNEDAINKPNNGQWEDDTCCVKRKANTKICHVRRQNMVVKKKSQSQTSSPQVPTATGKIDEKGGFMFGGFGDNGGLGTGLGPAAVRITPAASKEAPSSKIAGIGAAVSATGGFKLGGSLLHTVNASTSTTHAQTVSTTTTMHQKTSVDLSKPTQEATVSTSAGTPVKFGSNIGEPDKPGGFSFGHPSRFNFKFFEIKDKKVETKTCPKPPQSLQSPGYYDNKDDVDDIYFKPIVKLPNNVELKTGEEDEEVLFVYRAKLYRFDEEWKERGLGDVKILKHRTTERCRLLMRKKQVHTICMNHYVQADVELKPMAKSEGKTWIWHADDLSEGESQHEQFALMFKTEEIAAYFKTVYDCVRKDEPVPNLPEMALTYGANMEPKSISWKLGSVQPFSFTPDSSSLGFSTQSETPLSSVSSSKSEISSATNMPASPAFSGFSFKPTSSHTPATGAKTEGFKTPEGGIKKLAFSGSPNVPASSSTDSSIDGSAMSINKSSILASLLSRPASILDTSEALDLEKSSHVSTDKLKVPVPTTDMDNVIYVSTEQPSAELLAMANKYQLPPGFYLYEKRPDCKGCLGCLADDFDFSLIGTDAKVDIPRKSGSPQKLPTEATVKMHVQKYQRVKPHTFPDTKRLRMIYPTS